MYKLKSYKLIEFLNSFGEKREDIKKLRKKLPEK
jgi:hypothetical protein